MAEWDSTPRRAATTRGLPNDIEGDVRVFRERILQGVMSEEKPLFSHNRVIAEVPPCICPPDEGTEIRTTICFLCTCSLIEEQAKRMQNKLLERIAELEKDVTLTGINAEGRMARQFEVRMKKDEQKMTSLKQEIEDLTNDGKAKKSKIKALELDLNESRKSLEASRKTTGLVQKKLDDSEKELAVIIEYVSLIIERFPDELKNAEIKHAISGITTNRLNLRYHLDRARLYPTSENGNKKSASDSSSQVALLESNAIAHLEGQILSLSGVLRNKLENMDLIQTIKKLDFSEQVNKLPCEFRLLFGKRLGTMARCMFCTEEFFEKFLVKWMQMVQSGYFHDMMGSTMKFICFKSRDGKNKVLGTLVIDALTEASEEYKQEVWQWEKLHKFLAAEGAKKACEKEVVGSEVESTPEVERKRKSSGASGGNTTASTSASDVSIENEPDSPQAGPSNKRGRRKASSKK